MYAKAEEVRKKHYKEKKVFENLYQLLGEEYGEEAKDLVNKLKGI